MLQIEQTDRGAIVRLHGCEVARMYMTSVAQGKHRLHLEINDTGEETMELVLAVFRYCRAMGGLPVVG